MWTGQKTFLDFVTAAKKITQIVNVGNGGGSAIT